MLLAACGGEIGDGAPDVEVGPPVDVTLPDVMLDAGGSDVSDTQTDADVVDVDLGPPPPAPIPRVNIEISTAQMNELHRDVRADVEVPVSVEFGDVRYEDCEIEIHGGFARSLAKLSYRVRFDDSRLLETTLFSDEVEEHQRVVLQASGIDPTFMRNCLTLDLVRELGGLAPRCSYVELLFNGRYQGLYVAIERVDEHYLARNGLAVDGLVLKASTNDADWTDKEDPLDGFEIKLNAEAPTDAIGWLLEAIEETPLDFESYEMAVASLLDLNDFMTWQLAHTLADNRDTFRKNYYLHYDWAAGDARFRIITWDADATWGLNWDGELVDAGVKSDLWGRDFFSPSLFSIPEYLDPYSERYQEILERAELEEWLYAQLDRRTEWVRDAAERDRQAWVRPTPFLDEIDYLDASIGLRLDTMRQAFE